EGEEPATRLRVADAAQSPSAEELDQQAVLEQLQQEEAELQGGNSPRPRIRIEVEPEATGTPDAGLEEAERELAELEAQAEQAKLQRMRLPNPRRTVQRLEECLAVDSDLKAEKIVCRMITDTPQARTVKAWEATGSGAVAFREDATYGRIKAFCAL